MNKIKKYLIVIIATGLLGEIYFYPFTGEFRFSAGVIAFSLVLLIVEDLNEILLAFFTGIFILLLRILINSLFSVGDFTTLLYNNLPGAIYYISYGIWSYFFYLRDNKESLYMTIASLFCIDVISNIIEIVLRGNLSKQIFLFIIFMGLIRSILAYIIFYIIKSKEQKAIEDEYLKRYVQLNTLVSNIQAEMFYLKKSMKDIENVMSRSYALYEKNKENKEISAEALDIARQVHEIKKDYYRVIDGFDSFLKDFETNDIIEFKDIAFIIESNTKRYIKGKKKNIELNFLMRDNLSISHYYSIFTILNNLITNSIDAIEKVGRIEIEEKVQDDFLILWVRDNGKGIEEDLIPYIFTPGFTTKFDEKTGSASTGIGLSHVENIVDELKGEIQVKSGKNGTEFKICIPIHSLRR
ncbi:ATP-binding protein [Garciella nitratireducens]|uniref:ATP-binding protein n=1 Tax=Garciella nitratireducens TaxID=218205 RepID=UPI001BD6C23C|nr:ATP-binding protein [Garciella nitratireducens]